MFAESRPLARILTGGLVAVVLGLSACGQLSEARPSPEEPPLREGTVNVPTETPVVATTTVDVPAETPAPTNFSTGLPRCDDRLDVESYFAEHFDTDAFRELHPSFDRWELVSQPEGPRDTCLVDGVGKTAFWVFELPADISRYALSYIYWAFLTITPERTAHFARPERPEDLIEVAEAVPAVVEFLEKREPQAIEERAQVVGAGGFSLSGGRVTPLSISYRIDGVGSLTVSGAGRVERALLDPSQQWEAFPSLAIGDELVSDVLGDGPCVLREPAMAFTFAYWASGEPIEVEKRFGIECEDAERGVYDPRQDLTVRMNPLSGEYAVWWPAQYPNNERVAVAFMTERQLQAIKRSPVLPEDWEATH